MSPETNSNADLLNKCESAMEEIFSHCVENAPNFGISIECFKDSLKRTVQKYILNDSQDTPEVEEINEFLNQIQADDLIFGNGLCKWK